METFYHGTSVLFKKFDIAHALEGDGKAKFGFGTYVTEVYTSAAHYAYNKKRPERTDYYVYTLEIPDMTDDNHLFSTRPVHPSIVERTEKAIGEQIPEEAKSAGIPVILVDRDISTEKEGLTSCLIGADFYKEGYMAGEYLVRKADSLGLEHVNIVEITGTTNSTPMRQRQAGFMDAIAGDERMTVMESIDGDFLKSRGAENMRYLLETYGEDIDVVYSHNDEMTLGALPEIENAGFVPGKDIIIISIDGGQEAIDVLKKGKINCVVECTPKLGKILMETAVKLKAGESVQAVIHPEEQIFSDEMDTSKISPRGY